MSTPYREDERPPLFTRAWKNIDEHLASAESELADLGASGSLFGDAALRSIRASRKKVKRFFEVLSEDE